jgi:hypothetical protein
VSQELGSIGRECAVYDGATHFTHECEKQMEVMQGEELMSQNLPSLDEVTYIGP